MRRTVCASKIADATTLHGRYRQVYEGRADRTKSGLKKSDLRENRRGVIVSKRKQDRGFKIQDDGDVTEEFRANVIQIQNVSKEHFLKLAAIRTKKGGIKYKYWTDDDGDKFRIVSQRPLRIQFKNKETGEYEEELDWDQGDAAYTDDQIFYAPIMGLDYIGLSGGGAHHHDEEMMGGRRIRGGKYKKLADVTCGEKRGYPTRPTTMCVLVNKRRKSRKRPCKDGKVRRSGGRCAPGAQTPCKKEGQVRRKNSNTGKYYCGPPKRRKKKTIKQRQAECREKGKVYNRKSGRCRNKKKPKKKSKKSSNKKKKPKKTVAQKMKECKAKGLVYDRKTKRCRKKKSNKKKKKSKN